MSLEKLLADVAGLPKTFSALRICKNDGSSIEIHLSKMLHPAVRPGVRMHAGRMIEETLKANPAECGAPDWPSVISLYQWSPAIEPFLHVPWRD